MVRGLAACAMRARLRGACNSAVTPALCSSWSRSRRRDGCSGGGCCTPNMVAIVVGCSTGRGTGTAAVAIAGEEGEEAAAGSPCSGAKGVRGASATNGSTYEAEAEEPPFVFAEAAR